MIAKRALWLFLLLLLWTTPAAAQENIDPADWIPADFAGFVRLRTDTTDTLTGLNVAQFTAAVLQPQRFDVSTQVNFDRLVPLAEIAGVSDSSFAADVAPWLDGEFILAYRDIGDGFSPALDDTLMIFPSRNIFSATAHLSDIIQQQDLLEQSVYDGAVVYTGDRSSIALTPQAVLLGRHDLVEAALEVRFGGDEPLTARPAYRAIHGQSPADRPIVAYFDGAEALSGFSFVLDERGRGEPLLAALGAALRTFRSDSTLLTTVLSSTIDGVGVSVAADNATLTLDVTVTVHTDDDITVNAGGAFDPSLLELIPRRAMAVISGADAPGTVYDLLTALPLANFAGRILGSFPVQESPGSASGALPLPDSEDIENAVAGFIAALEAVQDFNLERDLIDHLSGDYAVALLPRPNNPTPLLNTPFDLLILARVDDEDAAVEAAVTLFETLLALQQIEGETVDEALFQTLRLAATDETVVRAGAVDGVLVVATGTAAELALNARRGNNRLVDEARWQALSGDQVPQVYLNLNPVINTFLPNPGGPIRLQIGQIGGNVVYHGAGVFQLDLTVTVPNS